MSERALYEGGPYHGEVAVTEGHPSVEVRYTDGRCRFETGQYTRAGRLENGLLLYRWEAK